MYELLYIVSPAFTDPQVKEVMNKVEALVTGEGGEVKKHDVLTKQPLAYPIKKQKHGTYVLMHLTLPPPAILKVERILRLEMGVEILRHMMISMTEVEAQAAFELQPYVYPLSERERPSSPRPRAPRRELPPPPPTVFAPKMSVEELDKKLDEILKDDTLENI
ncbi:TPA: 30S ribosomal protein S6 [Candidatus Uhrbacteria bacterium]|uniref:Small ribosomal subunit protein bS6 n=1 Tax=Candidatus Uhrbacteria bacterium GW2011_GWC2_53_7 TaxID=1618986 RepID=A0A0G1XZB8_9BACT|nr:MAG: 30S ribosomal protein S6 [Candidatus Uhrbacteria bacterium GW2011_GWC2_53_7]OGL71183.1 MAG: 30S ribosomal protein S6 [Candidatus Uhrbacteria bacterium RIFCSPHIGHO2_02_FULL_54_11]HBL39807.1 30S ribosomal protein S6 [Candidatus Uhrbacteria bacterium]